MALNTWWTSPARAGAACGVWLSLLGDWHGHSWPDLRVSHRSWGRCSQRVTVRLPRSGRAVPAFPAFLRSAPPAANKPRSLSRVIVTWPLASLGTRCAGP